MIVKSIEQNMECVYEARHVLCDYASHTITSSAAVLIPQKKIVELDQVDENAELITTITTTTNTATTTTPGGYIN